MVALIVFATLFVAGHLVLSSPPVRRRVVEQTGGERLFLALYSAVALVTFAAMVLAYAHASRTVLWELPRAVNVVPLLAMPFALLMVVGGLTAPNPAAVGQGAEAVEAAEARGVFAVTRHPFMAGLALWAVAHILVNGDSASLVLMGSVLILAVLGTLHIEARRRKTLGEAWRAWAKTTSWLPFLAMARGRARFHWGEVGWWRIALALVLYGALLWAHPRLFGVSPLPW